MFIDYSQTIDDAYENLEDYNPTKKRKVLILFDHMIADTDTNKNVSPIVAELLLTWEKRNVLLGFVLQSYFKVPKTIRLNAMHYFIMKITN